jgi:hypothetical protein
MDAEWFFETEGESRGPIGVDELRRLVCEGRIGPGTMLRRGRDEWVRAESVAGLFDGIATDASRHAEPKLRLDESGVDLGYRLQRPPHSPGGSLAVTAYGISTLVLASLLTIAGCLSGLGSAAFLSGYDALSTPPPPGPAGPTGNPGVLTSLGCSAIIGLFFLAAAIFLAVIMVVHLLLGGGQFAAGVGVLRRRPWGRILALVLSVFTASYGGLALWGVGSQLAQGTAPSGSDVWLLVLVGVVGVAFVAHAVLSWVVMFHPACADEFRRQPY